MPHEPEAYDAIRYEPPAPVARVSLRRSDGTGMVPDVVLLLDTGADITLLPLDAVQRLGVEVLTDQPYELAGFDGTRSFAPSADLDLILQGRAYRGRYVLTDEERGILGRDVLNHLAILLDGPRQQWSPSSH
jgi:hypothetical protein